MSLTNVIRTRKRLYMCLAEQSANGFSGNEFEHFLVPRAHGVTYETRQ